MNKNLTLAFKYQARKLHYRIRLKIPGHDNSASFDVKGPLPWSGGLGARLLLSRCSTSHSSVQGNNLFHENTIHLGLQFCKKLFFNGTWVKCKSQAVTSQRVQKFPTLFFWLEIWPLYFPKDISPKTEMPSLRIVCNCPVSG